MITSRVTKELFFLLRDRENDLFLSYLIKKRYLSRLRYMQISYEMCASLLCPFNLFVVVHDSRVWGIV